MTSYFPGDYYEVVWCNKGWATNFICTEMQNMPELWVPGVTNWCFPALFNFSVCYFCLSLESLPSTADLVSLSSSNLFISLIPLLNLTLKPLDIPCHGCSMGLHWHSCSGPPVAPAQGHCHLNQLYHQLPFGVLFATSSLESSSRVSFPLSNLNIAMPTCWNTMLPFDLKNWKNTLVNSSDGLCGRK